MNKYEKVKKYFDEGLWSINRVANAVVKGWITTEEYEKITGEKLSQEA
jgi:uncharacterized XkdX family phage protein